MNDNANMDKELAALTDRVLSGENVDVPAELSELADVVQKLHNLMQPDAPVDPAMRARLAQRLGDEWNRHHARRTRQPRPWYAHRLPRLVAVAASLTVILVTVALLSGRELDPADSLSGTASGSFVWGVVIGLVIALGIATAAAWWVRKRRRR